MKNNDRSTMISRLLVVILLLVCLVIDNVYAADKTAVDQKSKTVSNNLDDKSDRLPLSNTKMLYQNLGLSIQSFSNIDRYHISNKMLGKNFVTDKIPNPTRIIVDLNGLRSPTGKILPVNSSLVSRVRVGVHGNSTRLVFDIKNDNLGLFNVKPSADGLDIFIFNDQKSFASLNSKENESTSIAKNINEGIEAKDDSLKLAKLIDVKKDDEVKGKLDIDALESSKQSDEKHLISKILCYEKSKRLEVQVGIRDNVDNVSYELTKTSPSEYVLKLKNSTFSFDTSKKVDLPKMSESSVRVVKTIKDSKDSLVKFFVSPSTTLQAKKTKIGILVSEVSFVDSKKDLGKKEDKSSKGKVASISHEDKSVNSKLNLSRISKSDELKKDNKEKVASISHEEESVKAQPDLSKLVKTDNKKKSQEGEISIDDIMNEEEKGAKDKKLGEVTDIDEDLDKLLDPASGYTGKLISLDFQDTDIDNALKIIAQVSNLNIIASDDITGKVSLRLNNVPWDQALDVILKTNGLDKVQEGNVVRIAPVNTLKAEREALKAARQAEENLEPLQLAYRKVSYAKAAELQALVETVLSDRGSVTFDDRSNQIFIKDIKPRIKDAFEIIKKADLRTPQILLETQIIEAQRNLVRELGSEFGFSLIQSQETGNGTGYNFPSDVTVAGSNGDTGNTFSSFPAASGSAVSFIFDSLDGTKSLSARLSGLEEEGKIKTISKPSVVTTNNTPAEIKNVETIQVRLPDSGTTVATGQGSSASGSSKAATESIDVGITLKVTPQASPDYYVLLDVMGESSQFGSREVDGVPSIVIRRATSTVLVSSGQTFALGGVYKVTDKDSLSGVPFLKDIPVLGHFFRHSNIDNSDEELLFFVTPRIVEGSFDDAA